MKDKKILIGTALILLLLLTTGLSYAYFSTSVKGNDNSKDMIVEAGTLKLTYTDGPAINAQYIKPGWSTTKEVSIKNNGTLDANYNIIWQSLTNTIINDELVISATCQRLNASGTVEGTCESISQAPIKDTIISKNISIESGITHKYTFTILFKETNANQNYNQGKEFNGVLGIEEYKEESANAVYCTYNGELASGTEYTNEQYTYYYNQVRYMNEETGEFALKDLNKNGWSVILNDTVDYGGSVYSNLCTYINNIPVVSMSYMFWDSQAVSIDLSSFNTTNVVDMSFMFNGSQATSLDLSSFNTTNVVDMSFMFSGSQATSIDLSSFDTSNVTNMMNMFGETAATTLNLSNFDTSSVINMNGMFAYSQAASIDLSSFNTTNVADMNGMFDESQATSLDLSSFNTTNVADMNGMFYGSQATSIDLSSFDTSNVTDMSNMFYNSKATTLDLSSFDISKVTYMSSMFENSQATTLDLSSFHISNVQHLTDMFTNATNLKTIYVSSNFITDNGLANITMFKNCTNLVGGAGTKYDSKHVNNEYAHIDGGTSNPGYFTDIADKK